MKTKRLIQFMILWVSMALMFFPVYGAERKKVKEVSLSTYGVGSNAYVFTAAVAEAVDKTNGIKTRVVPAGTDVGRILPARAGEVDFCVFTDSNAFPASRGLYDFSTEEWGPQPLRIVWRGFDVDVGFYTRGDAGLKTLADLKGKRVAQVPGSTSVNNYIKGGLAFAGLTLKDVTVVNFPSHGEAARALTEGAIDMYYFGCAGSRPRETAASVHGIYWFNLDEKDTEGWKRLKQYVPFVSPSLMSRYAGKEKGIKPFTSISYPYNYWAYPRTSVDVVYAYVKAIWESYDLYKDATVDLPFMNHENALNLRGCNSPFHEGTIQFFKEIKVWTKKHEEFQQQQLAKESKRMEEWKKAQKEAKVKKIKLGSEEWKEFWKKKVGIMEGF